MALPKPGRKAKKVVGLIKLALETGKATPAPLVGPALDSKGVNIMAFCKDDNANTTDKAGYTIPVEITVYDDVMMMLLGTSSFLILRDKSFTFILKTPSASVLLLKAAGVVGKITIEQLRKQLQPRSYRTPDLNCTTIESAMRIIAGTAANMGIDIDPPVLGPPKKKQFV